jgi:myosin heavy subunit
MESARAELERKQERVSQIEFVISNVTNSTKIPDILQSDLEIAKRELNEAKVTLETKTGTFDTTKNAKEEAKKKVTRLLKETHEAQDAKQYKELRKKATEEAERAAADVNEKTKKVKEETSELETELAKTKDKQDLEKIKGLTENVSKAKNDLEEARNKLDKADVEDHFVQAAQRRKRGRAAAKTKREDAEDIRNNRKPISVLNKKPIDVYNPKPSPIEGRIPIQQNPVELPSPSPGPGTGAAQSSGPVRSPVPDPSSKQAPQPETQLEKIEKAEKTARRLENEAAEIEREYDLNPSWSSQIFGWLAKHWKSNDEQTSPLKTGMGSYV